MSWNEFRPHKKLIRKQLIKLLILRRKFRSSTNLRKKVICLKDDKQGPFLPLYQLASQTKTPIFIFLVQMRKSPRFENTAVNMGKMTFTFSSNTRPMVFSELVRKNRKWNAFLAGDSSFYVRMKIPSECVS